MFYRDYFTRIEDAEDFNGALYETKISSSAGDSKAIRLFEDCFSNHVDFDDPGITNLTVNTESKSRYINRDVLSAYFINEIYKIPSIRDYKTGQYRSYYDFINEFIETSYTPEATSSYKLGSNRIRYLLGDVGIGKSAFIKKTFCEIANNNLCGDDPYGILQVYINLEEHYHYGVNPKALKDDFLLLLFNKIYDVLEARKTIKFDRSNILDIAPNCDPLFSLKRLAAEVKKQKYRLVIYIDNLDFYHYFYARYSYFPKYNLKQFQSIHENIMWLISVFTSGDYLGHLGFNVLFAARTYVYDEVVAKAAGVNIEIDTTQAISISLPSEEVVISSRLELMSMAINKIVESKKGAGAGLHEYLVALKTKFLSEKIAGDYLNAKPINKIYRLGQHGYRSLVHFLSSLNIAYLDYDLMERFLERQASALYILYFNNMYRRYSQKQDHFPNMYLVDCTVMEGEGFDEAHKPHQHTYLLKYYVLKYIYYKKSVKLNELLDIFVLTGKYDDHVVRHALGSLCTANEFRCAEQDHKQYSRKLEARKISATERGRNLFQERLGVEFCMDFEYLETIIDDQWLCLPNCIFNEIYDSESDYDYLYYRGNQYSGNSVKTTLRKSRKIIYFLHLLKICHMVEIESNKPKLAEILKKYELVPDWDFIQGHIISTTESLLRSFPRRENEWRQIGEIKELRIKLKNNNSIEMAIKKYYGSDVMVSP